MKLTHLVVGLFALTAFGYIGFMTTFAVAENAGLANGLTTALAYLFTGGCFGNVLLEGIENTRKAGGE